MTAFCSPFRFSSFVQQRGFCFRDQRLTPIWTLGFLCLFVSAGRCPLGLPSRLQTDADIQRQTQDRFTHSHDTDATPQIHTVSRCRTLRSAVSSTRCERSECWQRLRLARGPVAWPSTDTSDFKGGCPWG